MELLCNLLIIRDTTINDGFLARVHDYERKMNCGIRTRYSFFFLCFFVPFHQIFKRNLLEEKFTSYIKLTEINNLIFFSSNNQFEKKWRNMLIYLNPIPLTNYLKKTTKPTCNINSWSCVVFCLILATFSALSAYNEQQSK